jgi:peptidoglycan/xylan/chitin deacetylase (PgdA/CDA1 family)
MARRPKGRRRKQTGSSPWLWGALLVSVSLLGLIAGVGYHNWQASVRPRPSPPRVEEHPTPAPTPPGKDHENHTTQPKPQSPKPPPAITRGTAKPELGSGKGSAGGKIAITFDAGAGGDPVPTLLAALDQYGVKCTFFLTGKWVDKYPEYARDITAAGHELGNHTYSHKDLRSLSDEEIRRELQRAEEAIIRATGVSPKPYFRPPYGGRDKRVLAVAAGCGYQSVYWTLDSFDSVKKGITAEEIRDRVVGRAKDGDIILCHCGSAATAAALPEILKQLKERFTLVPVSALAEAAGGGA